MYRRLLIIIMLVTCSGYGASRLTVWTANQVLTSAALNSEFDNLALTGTVDRTGGRWGSNDDVVITFGTSQDVSQEWDTGQTNDALLTGLSGSFTWIILDDADKATDFAIAAQTNPTLVVHSADGTVAKDYIWLQHDQTDARINVGSGNLLIQFDGTTEFSLGATGLAVLDDDFVGLGATSGRIIFDDLATDEIEIMSALVGINDQSPAGQLEITSSGAGTVALVVNTAAAATAIAQRWDFNTTQGANITLTSSVTDFGLAERNLGNNVAGAVIHVRRNSSAGTESAAAGTINLGDADSDANYVWADNPADPGVLRIHTAQPTGSAGTPTVSDTAGTVVGSQTSWHELKSNITPFKDYASALKAVVDAGLYTYTLNYDGRRRIGYVIYEEDRGSWFSYNDRHDQTPALDERAIFGYHAAAIKELDRRLKLLEER